MEISKFLGLRNTSAPEATKPGALEVAKDVDVDGQRKLRSRQGQTSVSATASHSLWASGDLCLVAQGSDLKRMDSSGNLTTLARLTSAAPISYAEMNGVVYFSNGTDTGRVHEGTVKRWGVVPPRRQPTVAATIGRLPAGRYQYAMTFVRSDGLESGANYPGLIELREPGGLVFSSIETSYDPSVVGWSLYVSAPNGVELYRVATQSYQVTTFAYQATPMALGIPLEPGYVEQAPPGTIVAMHGGCTCVVDGSVVWYSELYSLERFRRDSRFLQFPAPVTAFTSVESGIFVSTARKTYYLSGSDMTALSSSEVMDTGAILGTAVRFDIGLPGDAERESGAPSVPAVLWMSKDGVCLGTRGGGVQYLTADDYGIPTTQRGAAFVRSARGYVSYVAALQGASEAGNTYP